MNCRGCNESFGEYVIPRVMVSCGHTQCETCVKKALTNTGVECGTCKKMSAVQSIDQLPINEAVFNLSRSMHMCTTHQQKLSAICERDNRLLCLGCVLAGQHRNHKVTAIEDKVKEDKKIMREAYQKIVIGYKNKNYVLNEIEETIYKTQQDYKDYLLEVGVFFRNIKDQIQLQQQKQLQKGQKQMQRIVQKLKIIEQQCKKKAQNDRQALQIYEKLQQLTDINYLTEDHQRQMIVECSKQKKMKVPQQGMQFSRQNCLQQLLKQMEEMAAYERRKMLYTNVQTSPVLKRHISKEATVLEVNLNEEYHRRKAKKTRPAKSTITIQTNREAQAIRSDQSRRAVQQLNDSFTPVSIRSFMHSFLDNSVCLQRSRTVSQISVKESFTVCDLNTTLFHIGGKNKSNSSIFLPMESFNIEDGKAEQHSAFVELTECQSLLWKQYSSSKILIFGNEPTKKQTSLLEFDWHTGEIQISKLNMFTNLFNFGAVVHQKSVIIFGGCKTGPSKKTLRLDWINNAVKQTQLCCMSQERSDFGGIKGYDGRIYACGGMNKLILNGCERLDLKQNRWQHVGYMKEARIKAAIIATPDGIYVIGGYNGRNCLKSMEYFNYDSGKWTEMPQMPCPRYSHTAMFMLEQQTILTFGGYNVGPLDSIDQYNIRQQKWHKKGKMKQPRYGHCSIFPL